MALTGGQIKSLTLHSEPNPNEKLDLLSYKAISRGKIIFRRKLDRVAFLPNVMCGDFESAFKNKSIQLKFNCRGHFRKISKFECNL